jgi:hypothetical protein
LGEKDISEKILLDYNDVFSDIINGIIFKGEQTVLPESLENMTVHSQYKADGKKLHEQERDVAKYWKDKKITLAIYGFEDESVPEKQMLVRIIGYDGAAYRSQLGSEKISPVVTLVLYFGTKKRWNTPRNLKELLDIPNGLESYVNDYHINVIEVAWLSEDEINRFQSDFRIVANFFRNKRLDENYIPNDPTIIKHVDEMLKLLKVMTGDNKYEINIDKAGNGGVSMCTVAQNLENIGIQKGEQIGIQKGEQIGIQKGEQIGENKLAKLINSLMNDQRQDDVMKATTDKDAREKLYKEYKITD